MKEEWFKIGPKRFEWFLLFRWIRRSTQIFIYRTKSALFVGGAMPKKKLIFPIRKKAKLKNRVWVQEKVKEVANQIFFFTCASLNIIVGTNTFHFLYWPLFGGKNKISFCGSLGKWSTKRNSVTLINHYWQWRNQSSESIMQTNVEQSRKKMWVYFLSQPNIGYWLYAKWEQINLWICTSKKERGNIKSLCRLIKLADLSKQTKNVKWESYY